MEARYSDAVVLERRGLTDRIAELKIGAADGRALPMAGAGSHLELRFGGSAGYFLRHYSVVGRLSLDDRIEPFWRIAVQREDRARGSAHIHANFRSGTRLKLSRPTGAFRLARNVPHALLIAGGIGITPILPMRRSLLIRRQSFSLLYAGIRREAMAYADDALAMGGEHVRLHESSRDGTPDLDALLAFSPPGTVAYVCGPGPMIDALRALARPVLGGEPGQVRGVQRGPPTRTHRFRGPPEDRPDHRGRRWDHDPGRPRGRARRHALGSRRARTSTPSSRRSSCTCTSPAATVSNCAPPGRGWSWPRTGSPSTGPRPNGPEARPGA